ncbi:Ig-like domain-containing protein [Luteolibacter flavescens]|uniref:Ig-like domain-containing protein n=1 Tax=Luteolibacter flavescens TaxID=1859460 RepID=A0ABT3FSK6_9BACT|nr:discoidin domain-containing protein [Luteolibacter flavescens]MCW1886289.1 Ig-like domain-containing protein [Luteolibacter flavescens]
MLTRTASTQPGVMMPPLAKHVADDTAVEAITEYLQGLTSGEFAADPLPQARYVRFSAVQGGANGMVAIAEFSVLDGNGIKIPGATIEAFSSEGIAGNSALAIDGDPWTYWSTSAGGSLPKSITLDLEGVREIGGMEYIPRQDDSTGRLTGYEVHYSMDGVTWTLMTSASGVGSPKTQTYTGLIGRRKIRSSLAAAPVIAARDFPVTIVFDSPVTDFFSHELLVTGGAVTSMRGSGYYYVAMIRASQPQVSVSLPANVANAGPYGNSASQVLTIQSGLETPPVPTFTTDDVFHRVMDVRLSFDQPCSGLTKEDFTVTGGTLEWLIPDGDAWHLIVAAEFGQAKVTLREGAVMGHNGLQMGESAIVTRGSISPRTHLEAESLSTFKFRRVTDPTASGGAYSWTVKGERGANTMPDSLYSIFSKLNIRHKGNYRLRAWTRADDLNSDSFHVSLASRNVPGPGTLPWRCNQGPGEVGSGRFHAGFARNDGSDHVFPLTTGDTELYVYAAEDGTRIDRLSLIPERPYAIWSGTAVSSSPTRTMGLTFTSPVTGLSLADFETIGGQVTSLSGSGEQYTITLVPDAGKMLVRVKEHAVMDEFGATSLRSDWNFMSWVDTYEQWALDRSLGSQASSDSLDTDNDGLDQLTEYALGLDPKVPDLRQIDPADPASRGLPWVGLVESGEGKRLRMIFHRRRSSAPATYAVEFTGNLSDFTRHTDFTAHTEILNAQWERVTVDDVTATGAEAARFGRLVISREP